MLPDKVAAWRFHLRGETRADVLKKLKAEFNQLVEFHTNGSLVTLFAVAAAYLDASYVEGQR